jgi:hypothetical protein
MGGRGAWLAGGLADRGVGGRRTRVLRAGALGRARRAGFAAVGRASDWARGALGRVRRSGSGSGHGLSGLRGVQTPVVRRTSGR